jgi:hypothetical protein
VKNEIPKEKINLFEYIVRGLSTAIKNAALYSDTHPVFESSLKNLKVAVDNWFNTESDLVIGITDHSLLLNGDAVSESNDLFNEVALYFHSRGLAAIGIKKDVTQDELAVFVIIVKDSPDDIRGKGGLNEIFPDFTNLDMKVLDYSKLLGSAQEEVTEEENDIWQSLCNIGIETEQGELPGSKHEFLEGFLKNSEDSAVVLNKIYKQAIAGSDEKETALNSIRATIARVTRYFEKAPGSNSREARKEIADLIAKLDPELVIKVFEGEQDGDLEIDLAREITKDFNDDMLGDFIGSLISSRGGVNENLLKVFDKMMRGNEQTGSLASLVTEKVFGADNMDPANLAEIQLSVKELTKTNPEHTFMSQVYKMTLDAFVSDTMQSQGAGGELAILVRKFKDSMDEKTVLEERIDLILNLIWVEDDAEEFVKLTGYLEVELEKAIGYAGMKCLRHSVELFSELLRPNQIVGSEMEAARDKIMDHFKGETVTDKLVATISSADHEELGDIAYIFSHILSDAGKKMVDAFILEEDPFIRDQYVTVFCGMGDSISSAISVQIGLADIRAIKVLLGVLKIINKEVADKKIKELLKNDSEDIRLIAAKNYVAYENDEKQLFEMMIREKDEKVLIALLELLVKTENGEMVNKLFKAIKGKKVPYKHMLDLVKLCGNHRIQDSIQELKGILSAEPFLNPGKNDELRIAAVVSLGQIDTVESFIAIQEGLKSKRKEIKDMCDIILNSPKAKKHIKKEEN